MEKLQLLNYWIKNKIVINKLILNAFKKIKREDFVLKHYKDEAYDDNPLPIGHEQTISQPTTVMIMLEALELKVKDKVLEIGTGSGWSTALIAEVVKPSKVYSIEVIKGLVEFAKENLKKTKIKNIKVIEGDGNLGYEKFAPYNKIIINAACKEIPKALIKQLKLNGILIAPVGSRLFGQDMIKLRKTKKGLKKENLGSFVFVPLVKVN